MIRYKKQKWSKEFLHWVTQKDEETCKLCTEQHGKIYEKLIVPIIALAHIGCRCVIVPMQAITAGEATCAGGKRGSDRLLFSNDGLIFVTYDHYETFIQIVDEED